jgi:hypothetical protein
MRDYRVTYKRVFLICDNSSAIYLAQNSVFHGRAKYIKVKHHFLRDHVEKGDIVIKYIDTERQLTDISPNRLMLLILLLYGRGDLVFAIPMAWIEGELVL